MFADYVSVSSNNIADDWGDLVFQTPKCETFENRLKYYDVKILNVLSEEIRIVSSLYRFNPLILNSKI